VGNVRRFLDDRDWEPAPPSTGWGYDFVHELEAAGIALRRS
jgi:hypothetical protein